jgi:hypothetical protein
MHLPIPQQTPPLTEPSALVPEWLRGDVQWSRPIFKAPPLEQLLRDFDASALAQELRRIGLGRWS